MKKLLVCLWFILVFQAVQAQTDLQKFKPKLAMTDLNFERKQPVGLSDDCCYYFLDYKSYKILLTFAKDESIKGISYIPKDSSPERIFELSRDITNDYVNNIIWPDEYSGNFWGLFDVKGKVFFVYPGSVNESMVVRFYPVK